MMILLAIAALAVAAFVAWRLVNALKTDVVIVRGARFVRSEQPFAYWLNLVLLVIANAMLIFIATFFVFGLQR